MSPQNQPKHAPRTMLRATLLLAVGAALSLATPASATADQVTICHATGSESNPYVSVTASKAGVVNGHYGEDHQNGEDIIPPFTYNDQEYSQNWDTEGMAIFEAGCGDQDPITETETTTGSETETETEEIPFFGNSPATVAVGALGALGGAFLMLRRRL